MSEWKAKRFWKETAVSELEDGFGIVLDGRPVKTPAKRALSVPTKALADAIRAEWNAQEEEIKPLTMPFTRSANAALDKVAVQHAEVAEMLAAYGDSDLLCYRADSPAELVARQCAAWDPLLHWAEARFGARLTPCAGVIHQPQAADALSKLRAEVHGLDAFRLTGFHDLVSLSGSLIIGFAALQDERPAPDLWTLSRLDEHWQEEQWGVDEEAKSEEMIKRAAFLHAKEFLDLTALS